MGNTGSSGFSSPSGGASGGPEVAPDASGALDGGASAGDAASAADASANGTGSDGGPDSNVASSGVPDAAEGDGGPPWVDLFNGTDLTGFVVYSSVTHTTTAGTLNTGAAALALFQPENGMIHVYADAPDMSSVPLAILETTASYTTYNLSWDYKWGTKKFAYNGMSAYADVTNYPRDAGLLWALHGDLTQVWPDCIEFQNKWGTTGDVFAIYSQAKSLGDPKDPTTYLPAANGGTPMVIDGSTGFVQHHRSADWELTADLEGGISTTGAGTDWNSCLLQVNAGAATYTVNGHVVNQVLAVMDTNGNPVTSGPVAWQAESAEVYYRNLRIQVTK